MSSRKPPSNPGDWDDFDIPTWDDSAPKAPTRDSPSPSSSSSSRSSGRAAYPDPLYDDFETPSQPSRPAARPSTSGQQPPKLSNRVPSRTTRPSQQDPYRDPYSDAESGYDSGSYYPPEPEIESPPRAASASNQYDLYAEPAYDSGWGEAPVHEEAPGPRRRTRQRTRAARPSVSISRPAIPDSALAGIVGAGLISLILMVGAVWYGLGDLADVIPWHLNASGDVDQWISDGGLWRIPFGSFMALVIGLAMGAFLWKRDRFAARFIVTSMCVVQVLAWVAVIDQLW